MARSLTSALAAIFKGPQIRPIIFVEIHNDGATFYLWSGNEQISWNSHTWLGMGRFVTISTIPEASQIRADGLKLGLTGIDATLLGAVFAPGGLRQGKPVKVYVGATDDSGAVVADPYAAMIGRLDDVTVTDDGVSGTITCSVENRLIRLQQPNQRRYEDADQQAEYPGDIGFQFVDQLQQLNLTWGSGNSQIPQTASGGGTVGDTSGGDDSRIANP